MLIEETPHVLLERIREREAEHGPANGAELVMLFSEFCDEPCSDALPTSEDGDALLLQYGSGRDPMGQQVFYIDAVRQLIRAAEDVDEQRMYQLHMTFAWPSDAQTEALGSHNAWLMGDDDTESEAFWEDVLAKPGWEWFMAGPALDCRGEIYFYGVDEPADVPFTPYIFEVTSVPDAKPVILPYRFNQQPVGLWLGGPDEIARDVEQRLRDHMWFQIVLGAQEAYEFTDAFAPDYAEHLTEEQLEGYFDDLVGVRRNQQALWGPQAPMTNLTRAFNQLNAEGLLALEDFTCCGTCAAAEVWDEVDRQNPQPLYVYYHRQNAERFVTGRSGWVGFGLVPSALGASYKEWQRLPEPERQRRHKELTEELVRTRVLPVFAAHGIKVVWDGSAATNLELVGADFYCELE